MALYEFTCPLGHMHEARRDYGVEFDQCPCGRQAARNSVYRVNHSGFAGTPPGQTDFSQDYRRFEEASATVDYKLSRRESETGQPISVPLYQMGKQRADKLEALGVTADQITT